MQKAVKGGDVLSLFGRKERKRLAFLASELKIVYSEITAIREVAEAIRREDNHPTPRQDKICERADQLLGQIKVLIAAAHKGSKGNFELGYGDVFSPTPE